eukprot:171008-Chlamydomonas_euryale.AAC.1
MSRPLIHRRHVTAPNPPRALQTIHIDPPMSLRSDPQVSEASKAGYLSMFAAGLKGGGRVCAPHTSRALAGYGHMPHTSPASALSPFSAAQNTLRASLFSASSRSYLGGAALRALFSASSRPHLDGAAALRTLADVSNVRCASHRHAVRPPAVSGLHIHQPHVVRRG